MNRISYIRKHVLGIGQAKLAELMGCAQSSITRWEQGADLSLTAIQHLRSAVIQCGQEWNSDWLFDDTFDEIVAQQETTLRAKGLIE